MVTSTAQSKPVPVPAMALPEVLQRLSQQRDPLAWEALLQHSGADILQISRRILGDAALADDACQETLLQIRAYAGAFKPPVSKTEAQQAARVWIMRIATNIALRMGRRRVRSRKRDERGARNTVAVDENCPESNTLRGEQFEILQREVSELPETLREPILLRFYAEMDYPELGQALACSPDAAKKRVQRGIERLRVRLSALGLAFTLIELTRHLSGSAAASAAEAAASGAGTASAALGASNGVAVGLNAAQQGAWSALLKNSSAPAFAGALPIGGLSLMAKISLGVAALLLLGTSAAVVQHSMAEERRPSSPSAEASGKTAVPAARSGPEEPWKAELRGKLKSKISFEFIDTPLVDAIAFLKSIVNVNIVISPKAVAAGADKTAITLRVSDMDVESALKWIVKLAELEYDLRNQAIYIAESAEIAAVVQNPEKAAQALRDAPWKKDIMDRLQRKITVDFVDTPLDDAIAYFRTISNVNIIADPEVMEKPLAVNMRIKDMKTVDALIWMLKLVELEFELKDSALYIRKAADAGKQQPAAAKLPPPPSDF